MKKIIYLSAFAVTVFMSCSKDDSKEEIPTTEVKEVAHTTVENHKIAIQTLSGGLFVGYNDVYLSINDVQTGKPITPQEVVFYPEMSMYGADDATVSHTHTCPHSSQLTRTNDTYRGFSIFQMHTGRTGYWDAIVKYTYEGKDVEAKIRINVQEQPNKALGKVTRFKINDVMHIMAIISPENPKIGSNELRIGLYKMESRTSFPAVEGYTLKLDPRMPGEEMGNHSSPNNKDLTQGNDGFYHGIVNYTMSGNWALNFILLDKDGQQVAGSEVPSPEKVKECKCDYDKKSDVVIELTF